MSMYVNFLIITHRTHSSTLTRFGKPANNIPVSEIFGELGDKVSWFKNGVYILVEVSI